jgi:hypothetical protein
MEENKVKFTAIYRKKPSRPMKWLSSHKKLNGGRKLDYGCGRGFDAYYYKMDKYDLYWESKRPNGKYDIITCHFVLNVVDEEIQIQIIEDILNHLKRDGVAYFSVRRDLKEDEQKDGYVQRLVYLNLPSIHKNCSFEIYEMRKTK